MSCHVMPCGCRSTLHRMVVAAHGRAPVAMRGHVWYGSCGLPARCLGMTMRRCMPWSKLQLRACGWSSCPLPCQIFCNSTPQHSDKHRLPQLKNSQSDGYTIHAINPTTTLSRVRVRIAVMRHVASWCMHTSWYQRPNAYAATPRSQFNTDGLR